MRKCAAVDERLGQACCGDGVRWACVMCEGCLCAVRPLVPDADVHLVSVGDG